MTDEKQEVNLDEGTGPDGRMTMAEARAATIKPPMWRDRAYVLVPAWLAEQLPTFAKADEAEDPTVFARWFGTQSGFVWYVTGYDRTRGIATGFATSPMCPEGEGGDVNVAELEAQRNMLGLPEVERDFLFQSCPLSQVMGK